MSTSKTTTDATRTIDAARLNLLLTELRLPAVRHLWSGLCERSDKEGWPAARLLATLIEHELSERDRRRLERHLGEAKLLAGKTLAPGGHLNFPHPWPGQNPPLESSGTGG